MTMLEEAWERLHKLTESCVAASKLELLNRPPKEESARSEYFRAQYEKGKQK